LDVTNITKHKSCGSGYGSSISNESESNPNPGFDDQKRKKKNTAGNLFLDKKIAIY
jgi:hypothetical protein